MMNSVSSCCGARGCIDVYDPVKVKRLKEWAESDAKFLRRLSMKKKSEEEEGLFGFVVVSSEGPESLDRRLAFRQRYLRSYPFGKVKKEEKWKEAIKKIISKLLLKKKKKRNNSNMKEGTSACSLSRQCFNFLLSCVAQVDVHAH